MKTILIVDDEIDFALNLCELFQNAGYITDKANNGKDAIKKMALKHYDIIISDVLMPDMDGFELALKLGKDNSINRLIVMSGGGRLEKEYYLKTIKKLGAIHTIPKPFSFSDLMAIVEKI